MKCCDNTKRATFRLTTLLWSIILASTYQFLLFRSVDGLSYVASKLVFWSIVIVITVLGMIVPLMRGMNALYPLIISIAPINCYTMLSFGKSLPIELFVFLGLGIISVMLYYLVQLIKRRRNAIHQSSHERKSIRQLLHPGIILTAWLSLFTLVAGISVYYRGFMTSYSNDKIESGSSNIFNVYSDSLICLEPEKWDELNETDKVLVLQDRANEQAYELGLSHTLTVEARPLPQTMIALYNDDTHCIAISVEYLNTADVYDVLCALLHEVYHAAEHRMCDAYDSLDPQYKKLPGYGIIECYKEDLSVIMGHSLIMTDFFFHKTEIDARTYAEDTAEMYYDAINEPKG